MKIIILTLFIAVTLFSCQANNQDKKVMPAITDTIPIEDEAAAEAVSPSEVKVSQPSSLVPQNFVIFEEIYGDLNKDGIDDCVLIIKDTNKDNIVHDEYRGELDRNRRGIIIALKDNNLYNPIVRNYSCFASENEDGGVYFAPELSVEINQKGNLDIQYGHGRYGGWGYTFRYQNDDFEMIGYYSDSNRGPVGLSKESINFSTKKRVESRNVNEELESGSEEWEDTWTKINDTPLLKLDNIEDFDEISFKRYYE